MLPFYRIIGYEVDAIIIPMSQMRKLRLKEVNSSRSPS